MNGLLVILYVACFICMAFSLRFAAKSKGAVRATALLISLWSFIIVTTVYSGQMNMLIGLGNITFLYLLLLLQQPAVVKKQQSQLITTDEQQTENAVPLVPRQVVEVDDEAKLIEQEAHMRMIKTTIENYFNSTLPFRKHGYSIGNLSLETGIPVYQLSSVINQEFGMNFNELINSYRVTYLTNILQDSFDLQSYTLEALGKMAGFSSRTTFIAAIKKHTGMTPSTFFKNKKSSTIKKVEKQEAFLMKVVA
jgi:AraC-like DNA-binding protein